MACRPIKSPEIKCSDKESEKVVFIINQSDVKFVDGVMKIKRTYGKFKRPVFKF